MYENVTMLKKLHRKSNDNFHKHLRRFRSHTMASQSIKAIILVINSTATTKSVMPIVVVSAIRKKIEIINETIKITIISVKNTTINFVTQPILRLSTSNDSLKLLLDKLYDRNSRELFLRSLRFQLFHRRQLITTVTKTK